MHVDSDEEEKDNDPRIIPSYSLKLPTVADLLSQRDLQQESSTKQTKDDRFTRKGKFAKVVMDSPNNTKNYTLEKERKHKECEINKTLYGSFSNQNGDLPFIDAKELLRATIKHIDKTHIEAFYKTAPGKFIIVLNSEEQKKGYAREINFREEIQNVSLSFGSSPDRTHIEPIIVMRGEALSRILFLPTISNIAVKKVFMEFGEVHSLHRPI